MTYQEQLETEKRNLDQFNYIIQNVSAEEFNDFYFNHTREETRIKYGISSDRQLIKILNAFNYDFSKKKPSGSKGKPSTRSHESYKRGGEKSAQTQKAAWTAKSEEEKAEQSEKMQASHNTSHFKSTISQINKEYYRSLSEEEKQLNREIKSKKSKEFQDGLNPDEQKAILANRFKNGRTYKCKNTMPNQAFAKLLDKYNVEYTREFCLDQRCFDFKVGNCLIEINPSVTHNATQSPFKDHTGIDKHYHRMKSDIAEKYGYRCIHIFDQDDPEKIIKNFFCRENKKIYARKCTIQEVTADIAEQFINKYHIQGYTECTNNIGLFCENELSAIMAFRSLDNNKKYNYELARYCAKYSICGGAEKLFKYFIKNYSPNNIVSYCDRSKFLGNVYGKLNFTIETSTESDKHQVNMRTKQQATNSEIDGDEDLQKAGFVEVYDCGQTTYIYKSSLNQF